MAQQTHEMVQKPNAKAQTMLIKITFSNSFIPSNRKETKEVPEETTFEAICDMHTQLSKLHPDDFINFVWKRQGADSNDFICGQAYNMQLDEKTLSYEEYSKKWYNQ